MTRTTVEFRRLFAHHYRATVREYYTPGWIGRMLKFRPKMWKYDFVGSLGYWVDSSADDRAGLFMTRWLDARLREHLADPMTKVIAIFRERE